MPHRSGSPSPAPTPAPGGGPGTDETAFDAIIIGDGIIGLSTALALRESGVRCAVLGRERQGAASLASAGLLAPAGESLAPDVRRFFLASQSAYPAFVEPLQQFDPQLTITRGLVERTASGDLLHAEDGSVDPVRLVRALRTALEARPRKTNGRDTAGRNVRMLNDAAVALAIAKEAIAVSTESGATFSARDVVLAAGAWSAGLDGLPRALPVEPLKGQMIAFDAAVLDAPVMGEDVYVVPRGHETLAGATVEHAGFDSGVDLAATQGLAAKARAVVRALRDATVSRDWVGFRPGTPDLLPIIGRDPAAPRLIYACGHSKNGILLAPATAQAVAALITHAPMPHDLQPFSIERFSLPERRGS